MAITRFKRLAASGITSAGTENAQTLYENPSISANATSVIVCNTTDQEQIFNIAVNSENNFQTPPEWIAYNAKIKPNDSSFINTGILLDSTRKFLLVSGTSTGLVFSAFGTEVQSNNTGDYRTLNYGIFQNTEGIKAPVYGSGGGPYPPTGWTGILNGNVDDYFYAITNIPSFYMAGQLYTQCYIGTNTYITFGSGSNVYSGLSEINPPFPKFFLGSADNSAQRISKLNDEKYTRIRYEGLASAAGASAGSPTIVLEITLFNMSLTNNVPVVEVLVGNHNRLSGKTLVASSSVEYANFTMLANNSYVFVGNANGTAWTVYSGYYIANTGY